MRENYFVTCSPDFVAENVVVGIEISGAADASDGVQGVAAQGNGGPSAKRIPSSMSAITTPEGISTDIPRASSRDQKSAVGSPRYKHVTSPSLRSNKGGITLRRKSRSTRTSLSEITKKSLRE